MPPAASDILVIVPCYNEANSIVDVVRSIQALGDRFHPLVVDDGSHDQSFALASPLCRCLQLPSNLGIGGAVQAGIRYAALHGYQFCAQIDGDGQHIATELLKLVAEQKSTQADLVYGSRYLENTGWRSTFMRRLGGRILALTLRLTFGVRLTDPTSGLRLLNQRCINLFKHNYPYDYPEPVSLAMVLAAGLHCAEVPAVMKERAHGVSSIAGIKQVAYMVRVISFILLARIKSL